MKHLFITMIIVFSFVSFSLANIIHVPADQPTIQAGINAAVVGDTVLVVDNTYYENINFKGKAITVASHFLMDGDTNHIGYTIIDGSQPSHPDSGSVVYFISGEDTNSVLCGFTITGGSGTYNQVYGERDGGGICIFGAGAHVFKNRICNNSITYNMVFGVGIAIETTGYYYAIIEENVIYSNTAVVQGPNYCNGGGIAAWIPDGGARIKNNIIRNNILTSQLYISDLHGGGIHISCGSPNQTGEAIIEGNTIANNIISPIYLDPLTKGAGISINCVKAQLLNNKIFGNLIYGNLGNGGGISVKTSQTNIVNNIIFNNSALNGGGIFIEGLAEAELIEGRSKRNRENSLDSPLTFVKDQEQTTKINYIENFQDIDQPVLINNTITQNFAQSRGGGIYSIHTAPLIMNTIIWEDSAGYTGNPGLDIFVASLDTLNIAHSLFDSSEAKIVGNWAGQSNIHVDPLLEDTVLFHLTNASPCIGAGIDAIEIDGNWYYAPPDDIDGDPRPWPAYTMPDMGADENPLGPSNILYVPQEYPSIQAGINAAVNGDTVLVADSTYYENINFKGKAITVASHFLMDGDTSHISHTIIDGSQLSHPDSGSVVYFISGEDTNSVLCGFTITGGTGTPSSNWNARVGGGIYVCSSGARIIYNHIQNNSLDYSGGAYGGGIECDDSGDPVHYSIIQNNKIRSNSINCVEDPYGGGVELWSNGRIIDNQVSDNSIFSENFGRCHGGGIFCGSADTLNRRFVLVDGNVIENNQAFSSNANWGGYGGGLYINRSDAHVTNNTIQYNEVSGGLNCVAAGMAMWASGDTSVIRGNLILENRVVSGNCFGGGLQLHTVPSVIVEQNRIEGNEGSNGGGIVCTNAKPFIQNNLIIENSAVNGGGILCYVETDEKSSYSGKFREKRADTHSAVNHHRGRESQESLETLPQTCAPRIINNTIVGNRASNYGGGLCTQNSDPIIMNTILWEDSAQWGGHEIYHFGGTIEVHYCDVQGGWAAAGTSNIDADPCMHDSVMVSNDTMFCCLNCNSPCIDAGNPLSDYYDLEDPMNPGFALWPAMGALRNDMGAYGGHGNTVVGIKIKGNKQVPRAFILRQNYPNPFNPSTDIEFDLPKASKVTLKIFNILGEEVVTLVSDRLSAGAYSYEWSRTGGIASGVYLYRLEAGDFVQTRKMILMK